MRRLQLLVSAIVFVDTAFFAAIAPLLPYYTDAFDLSKAEAGLLVAAYPAGTMLGSLPGGWLAGRLGVRAAVLLGLAMLAGSSVAFAFAPTFAVLLAARFVQGLGGAATWSGALGWLTAMAPRERRGEVIGSAFGVAIAGALCGPVLGGAADRIGPEVVFSTVGVAALGLAWVAARTPALPPEGRTRVRDVLESLQDLRIAVGAWIIALLGLVFGVLSTLAPLRLSELGAGATVIAATFLVSGAIEALVSPVMGRVSDRRGPLVPSLVGLLAAALAMLVVPWPAAAWLLIGVLVVGSPAIGILWTPAMALLSEGADDRGLEQGFAFALMNLAWAAGETLGAAGGARLADATADRVPYLLLAALCAITFVGVRRRAGRRLTLAPHPA